MDRKNKKIYEFIAIRIKDARKKANLSQADLARIISMSRVSVTNMESGKHTTSVEVLWEIAKATNLEVSYFLPSIKEVNIDLLPEVTVKERVIFNKAILKTQDALNSAYRELEKLKMETCK